MKKIVASLMIVIAVALIGFGVYMTYNNKDKVVFSRVLTKFVDNLEASTENGLDKLIPSTFNFNFDQAKINTDTYLSVTEDEVSQKIALKGDLYLDQAKSKLYADANLVINNDSLAKLKTLFEGTKMYIMIEDVTNNFYYTDTEMNFSEVETDIHQEDTTKLAKYLKEAVLENLKDSDFTSEKKTIELNGKDYNTKKITLNITEKKLLEIMRTFLKKIEKDSNLKDLIEKSFAMNSSEETFEDALKELDDQIGNASEEILFTYDMYVYGKDEAIKQVITVAAEDEANVVIINLNSYENSNGFRNYELTMGTKDQSYLSFSVKGTSSTKSDIKLDAMSMIVLNGTYEITNQSADLDMAITIMGQECGTFQYTLNTVTENKEYELIIKATIDVDTTKMTISSINKLYVNEQFPDVDVTNSKAIEEITEEEQEKLMDLMEKIETSLSLGLNSTI